MEQTQRHIRLALMIAMDIGAVALFLFVALMNDYSTLVIGYGAAAIIVGALAYAYWRGWDPARYLAVLFVTLGVGLSLGSHTPNGALAFEMFLPAISALLLLETRWVLASGILMPLIVLVRAPGDAVYSSPENLALYIVIIAGLVVSRFSTARFERALHASERMFRAIYERSGMGIALSEPSGRILMANPAFQQMLGFTEEEIRQRSFYDLSHADDVDREHRHVEWALTCRDMTQRRQLEKQLRQSQKLHALGQLAGGVAHDFNNLLTVIDGYTQLLLYTSAGSAMREQLEQIQDASRRATNLTRRLLAFSRQEVLDVCVLDLNAVIIGTVSMLKRLIGDHILLQTRLQSDLGAVKADIGQIEQILMNLAVNARDAMEHGGELWIETRNVTLPDQGTPYVCISIRDSGVGMDAATRARIFEPFFTTKPHGEGTGLGLAIVQGIVQQYGGMIRVESAPGVGTSFEILLPRSMESANDPQANQPGSLATGAGELILLVEDNLALRRLTRRMLEQGGYRVLDTVSEQAQALYAEHAQNVRLLVTDVAMPYLNGYELAEQFQSVQPDLPILFISGHADSMQDAEQIGRYGGEFLAKPFTLRTLLDRVNRLMAIQSEQRPTPVSPLARAVGE